MGYFILFLIIIFVFWWLAHQSQRSQPPPTPPPSTFNPPPPDPFKGIQVARPSSDGGEFDLNALLKSKIGAADGFNLEKFKAGDKVYLCKRCQLAYHEDSWQALQYRCTGCKTSQHTEIHFLPVEIIWNDLNTVEPSRVETHTDVERT